MKNFDYTAFFHKWMNFLTHPIVFVACLIIIPLAYRTMPLVGFGLMCMMTFALVARISIYFSRKVEDENEYTTSARPTLGHAEHVKTSSVKALPKRTKANHERIYDRSELQRVDEAIRELEKHFD